MFDIDKYLDDLRIKEFEPSDSLVEKTKTSCEKYLNLNKEKKYYRSKNNGISKAALITIPAAAMLLIGVVLGAIIFGSVPANSNITAFYTVDINPSVCVNVDENEIVTSIESQNEDAKKLLNSLDCVSKTPTKAIEIIIKAAKQAGYLNSENTYVLVGRFGDGNKEALEGLQAQLENSLDDMIQLLIVSGSLKDKHDADELNVSAGLLKLSQMAEGIVVKNNTNVEDVVDELSEYNQGNYTAPSINATSQKNGITLSWNELNFEAMGYTGNVSYNIMTASTKEALQTMKGIKIGNLSFLSTDTQTTSYFIDAETELFDADKYRYFSVYAVYSGNIYVLSNIVYAKMPNTEPTPSPSPTALPSPSSLPTPTPQETEPAPVNTPQPSVDLVSGYISGDNVKLSWQKNQKDGFKGYKIVASKNNEHPSYPEDGYLKYITDENTTSKALYEGYKSLKGNTYYYFSITYLYEDGSKIVGNAVRLKVPKKDVEEPTPTPNAEPTPTPDTEPTPTPNAEPTPTPDEYASTNISGSIDGNTIHLSWSKIDDSRLEGYKVVYSFSNQNPIYKGDNSHYKYWITNPDTTSCSLDITSLKDYSEGKTCYFSITALYDAHSVKKPGNAVSFTVTAAQPYPSTNISVSLNGNNVAASWAQIDDERLEGYKVVASFIHSDPYYSRDKYAAWITDITVTNFSIPESFIKEKLEGYSLGATCYFAITAIYKDDTRKTGTVDSLVYPY